jgi:hypothetical protein
MATPISNERLRALFEANPRLPCREGTGLLHTFAVARPADFSFLNADDLLDLQNSAFTGIPEWEAFFDHYGACEACNA